MKKILILCFMFLMATGFAIAAPNKVILLEDDFSGDLSQWTEDVIGTSQNLPPNVVISNGYMDLEDDAVAYASVDTTGYSNIEVSYDRRTRGTEFNDELRVGWKTGSFSNTWSDWTEIDSVSQDNTWDSVSFTLASGAENTQILLAYFIDDGNGDHAYIDKVVVTGQDIDGPVISVDNDPEFPMCTSDVNVCATVTDFSGVGSVDITCSGGNIKTTHSDISGNDNEYCALFSATSMGHYPADGTDLKCTVNAEDIYDNSAVSGPTVLATYDCEDPNAIITGDLTCNEGEIVTLSGSNSWDSVTSNSELIFEWTGVTTSNGDSATVNCIDDGIIPVSLKVTDNVNRENTDNVDVSVSNVDPVAFANGPYFANEGSNAALSASETDDGALDTHTFAWDLDDDGSFETAGQNVNFACIDDSVNTVTVEVTDKDGGIETDSTTITCNNVAPVIIAGSDLTVNEGDLATVDFSFSDVGLSDTHTATVDWESLQINNLGTVTSPFSDSEIYCNDGSYDVAAKVTDDDGGSNTASLTVTVNNVPATFDNLPESTFGVAETSFTYDVDASDVGCDKLTYSLMGEPSGMTINSETGLISWIPTRDQGEDYVVTIKVYDGSVYTDAELSIHVYDYSVDLDSDWNLFSIPLVPTNDDTSINHVLGDLADEATGIWEYKYDATEGRNVWKYSESDGTTWETDVSDIIPGYGYYIRMNDESTLYGDGEMGYALGGNMLQVELTTGWNLIGHYGLNEVNKYHETSNLAANGENPERHLASMTLVNEERRPARSLIPGEGYWVFNTNSGSTLYAPSTADFGIGFQLS